MKNGKDEDNNGRIKPRLAQRFSLRYGFWPFLALIFILPVRPGLEAADKCAFSASPVRLTQDSQKAIIFHNKQEEILVLATELRAEKETVVLEFIPFPSEPQVFLVKGPILEKVNELLKKKDIQELLGPTKGGGSQASPVEIKLSQKIGLHEVTVVEIKRPAEFENWVREFFRQRKMPLENRTEGLLANARDYLDRGFRYFVFDSVVVGNNTRMVEPLGYRFKSTELYYPLKTSNLIGGSGKVDLILFLPGSFFVEELIIEKQDDRYFKLLTSGWSTSSSSKMYPKEIEELLPEAAGFFKPGQKIYLQLLRYEGNYDFKDDWRWDISALPPYAFKLSLDSFLGRVQEQKMTEDEMKDYFQARCAENPNFLQERRMFLNDMMLGYLLTSGLNCEDFVHPEEFQVYRAIFNPPQLSSVRLDGLPTGFVVLEDLTRDKRFENIKEVDKALLENYNSKNKRQYRLSEFLPEGMDENLRIREGEGEIPLSPGRTYVSRVGFNPGRTAALVFVSHVAGPEMGAGYLILLEKHQGGWIPVSILSSEIY